MNAYDKGKPRGLYGGEGIQTVPVYGFLEKRYFSPQNEVIHFYLHFLFSFPSRSFLCASVVNSLLRERLLQTELFAR